MMLLNFRRLYAGFSLAATVVLAACFSASAQTNYYGVSGGEYAVADALPGDQVFPEAAISAQGGYLVWQDNATDGNGLGVSAQRLNSSLSPNYGSFRVNAEGAGDQANPQVALLKNGGAVFVWQGGYSGSQHIFARFLGASGTFLTTNDVLVNAFTNSQQLNPSVAVLNNSNVVFVWASDNEVGSNSMQDVYGQIFSQDGKKMGGEFLINQFTTYNQRTPVVTALAGGGFVVAWVSEQQRVKSVSEQTAAAGAEGLVYPSVDIYSRIFDGSATPLGNEFLVNADNNVCANPRAASGVNGGFMIAWSGKDLLTTNGWDIYARSFSATGSGDSQALVNTYTYGDQYAPKIGALHSDYLISWTSLAQDGSGSGVYARFLHANGSPISEEFRANTTTVSQQMQPTVVGDGESRFLVAWSSYTEGTHTFDLLGQRYSDTAGALPVMDAPFVWAPFVVSNGVYQPQLIISWSDQLGLSVSNYQVYVDGSVTPTVNVTSNQWVMTAAMGLTANSTHSFRINYTTADDRSPTISPSASGTTWSGCNYFNSGVPCEWVSEMYGTNSWPYNVNAPLTPGGPTLLNVFLSGGDPLDPSTWLQTSLVKTSQGFYVHWNTKPGFTYQVQTTTNFTAWQNLGTPRFAAGTDDSIYVGTGSVGYYRVVLLR